MLPKLARLLPMVFFATSGLVRGQEAVSSIAQARIFASKVRADSGVDAPEGSAPSETGGDASGDNVFGA